MGEKERKWKRKKEQCFTRGVNLLAGERKKNNKSWVEDENKRKERMINTERKWKRNIEREAKRREKIREKEKHAKEGRQGK